MIDFLFKDGYLTLAYGIGFLSFWGIVYRTIHDYRETQDDQRCVQK